MKKVVVGALAVLCSMTARSEATYTVVNGNYVFNLS